MSPSPVLSAYASPAQFSLIATEGDWVRTTLVKDLHQPDDWFAGGRNFLNGQHYVRLEIMEKPTDIEVMVQICLWSGINEMCPGWHATVSFRHAGVYFGKVQTPYEQWLLREAHQPDRQRFTGHGRLTQALMQWWVPNPTVRRGWSVLRTSERGGVGAGLAEAWGEPALAHLPIRYALEYVLVARGEVFEVPPSWRGAPPAGDAAWDFYRAWPEFLPVSRAGLVRVPHCRTRPGPVILQPVPES